MNESVVSSTPRRCRAMRLAPLLVAASAYAAGAAAGPVTVTVFDGLPGQSRSPVEVHTASCAAAIRAGELHAAAPACERAIVSARAARLASTPLERAYGGGSSSIDLAVAYSNRAVLNHLFGNKAAARADIAAASAHAPRAEFIGRNVLAIAGYADRPLSTR